jgi:hypothetical protein
MWVPDVIHTSSQDILRLYGQQVDRCRSGEIL